MTRQVYPVAQAVAETVTAYFERQLGEARAGGRHRLGACPVPALVEAFIDAGFWASLRREEGRSPKISMAYLAPEQAGQPLVLENALPLSPEALTRLAPAVMRPGIHLGVWHDDGQPYVWGATRNVPCMCFVLEVVQPGLLVIKYSRGEEYGKYSNIAVLQGDSIKVVDEDHARRPDGPLLLGSLVGLDPPVPWLDTTNGLVQLSVSMRAHGHGGTLLVVPDAAGPWRDSIVHPIPYVAAPPFSKLAELMQAVPEEGRAAWQEALRRSIEGVAGLTAVDGATVITDRYHLLAFGAKITRAPHRMPVPEVVLTEPVLGNRAAVVHPSELGGTRHLSAAQFAFDQRDALALVASQDGRFTVFTWSAVEACVHAHQIEALLL